MDLKGQGVVVTGAAGGIGAAIAARFAAEGARVVVNDIDATRARECAERIGAYAVPGDAASTSGVTDLVTAARERLGSIDVFCANAGIETGSGLETSDADWARALDVNVMAHIRAARLLVPTWLATGGGRFVVTASAAGLLSMIGSAPYSVTKHAAVAFAEWMSITYRHRGVTTHAICPQGVRTRMLEQAGPLTELLTRDRALEPEEVADALLEAMSEGRFLVLPHPQVAEYYAQRATHPDAWLSGMNKLQQRFETTLEDHAATPREGER